MGISKIRKYLEKGNHIVTVNIKLRGKGGKPSGKELQDFKNDITQRVLQKPISEAMGGKSSKQEAKIHSECLVFRLPKVEEE